MNKRTAAIWLAAGLCSAVPAWGGTVIETSSSEQGLNRMLISGDRVRMESGGRVMLFDASSTTMTFVDPSRKQYQVMDEQDVRKMAEQMKQMRAQIERQLENVPEGQRE